MNQPATIPERKARPRQREREVKVVHLTSVHRPTDQRIFLRECRTLARHGYRVTIVAPHEIDSVQDGVAIRAVPRPRSRSSRMTTTLLHVYREALRQNADVYHFHDPELIPIGLLLRLRGKQVIYDMHENVPAQILTDDKRWIPRFMRRPLSWLFAAFERTVAPFFSAIVTANTEITRHAQPMNRRVVLLGNYPEAGEFLRFRADPARHHSGRIVNFGGISFRSCTRELVEALEQLPPELEARMILGGAATSAELASELASMAGWGRVESLGPQPRARMIDELRHAAVAVVLFSPAPNHLGIGSNRFYEALAAGVPVFVSNFPLWRATIDRLGCGIAVNPCEPSEIASAISYLLTHPAEAAEMGERGRQAFLNEYCWDAEEPKLLALYQQLTAA